MTDRQDHNTSHNRLTRSDVTPVPEPTEASINTGPNRPLDSGVDISSIGELHSLSVALSATTVELNAGSQVVLTINGRRDILSGFDTAGDRFGNFLDTLIEGRAEDRETFAEVSQPLSIDHQLTNDDIMRYFKSVGSYNAEMEFKTTKRCEFEYGGTNHGPSWVISLVDSGGELNMKWEFDYEK